MQFVSLSIMQHTHANTHTHTNKMLPHPLPYLFSRHPFSPLFPLSQSFITACTTPQSNSPDTVVPTTNTIFLSWTPPLQPSCAVLRYILFFGRDEADPATISVIDVGTSTNYTVQDLLPYTQYSFRLQVTNERGSVRGPWAAARTLEGLPQNVPAPEFVVLSATQLFVTWNVTDVPGGPILEHVLYRDSQRVGSFQNTLYEASDLTPYEEYSFAVEACTAAGCTRSAVSSIRMPEAPPTGQSPPGVFDVQARSFRVSWSPPANPYGVITAYEVYVRDCGQASSCTGVPELATTAAGTDTQALIGGRAPFTVYQVQVRAINSQGVATSAYTTVATINGQLVLLRTLEAPPQAAGQLTCTPDGLQVTCTWADVRAVTLLCVCVCVCVCVCICVCACLCVCVYLCALPSHTLALRCHVCCDCSEGVCCQRSTPGL